MNLVDLINKYKISRIVGVSQSEDQGKANQVRLSWGDKSALDMAGPIVLMTSPVGDNSSTKKKKTTRSVSASSLHDHVFYFSKATGVSPSEFLSHPDPLSFISSIRSFGLSPLVSDRDSIDFLQKYSKLLALGESFSHNGLEYSLINKV